MIYIGIDPGEAWCGFAALEVTSRGEVRVEARTYSVEAHGGHLAMSRDLIDLIPRGRRVDFVCEDFRIRRSGHQRFSRGDTLRFLGALEYGVACRDQSLFYLIQPNDHGEIVTKELFGRIFRSYRQSWSRRNHEAWGHCVSAWRVLGMHLFHHERDLLMRLQERKKSHRCDRWLPTIVRSQKDERIAPAALWVTR